MSIIALNTEVAINNIIDQNSVSITLTYFNNDEINTNEIRIEDLHLLKEFVNHILATYNGK
jgi:hypothetical protein